MRPFLKWAGNKYRALKYIQPHLTTGSRLIEPFVGSCAVTLNTDYPHCMAADANCHVIDLYNILKEYEADFIEWCSGYFRPETNVPEYYYATRADFNRTPDDTVGKAALFLYLNRHGFNGLCRYNRSGGYNVPFGKYKKPYFPRDEMMNFVSRSDSMEFICQDFRETMLAAEVGDVVYCDPPYTPVSETGDFTTYTANGFTDKDHGDLVHAALAASSRGAKVIVSNHDTDRTRLMYKDAKQIVPFEVGRRISAKAESRGNVMELLAIY